MIMVNKDYQNAESDVDENELALVWNGVKVNNVEFHELAKMENESGNWFWRQRWCIL